MLSNRARVLAGRARLLRDHGGRLDDRGGLPLVASLDAPAEEVDAFYAAWVEELLQQAVERSSPDITGRARATSSASSTAGCATA